MIETIPGNSRCGILTRLSILKTDQKSKDLTMRRCPACNHIAWLAPVGVNHPQHLRNQTRGSTGGIGTGGELAVCAPCALLARVCHANKPTGGRTEFCFWLFVLFLWGSALLTLKRLDSIMKLDQKSKSKDSISSSSSSQETPKTNLLG